MPLAYDKSILLIDTGYYVFYRYYATLRWYQFQKTKEEEIDYLNLFQTEDFVEAFKKHIKQDIIKWNKKWNVDKNILFCIDCYRADIWRMNHCNTYKGTRVKVPTFNGDIFTVFYDFIKKENYMMIDFPNLEADDIIYLIANKIKSNIIILTNDNDYLQMKKDNIELVNMQGKNLMDRSIGDPQKDLLLKIIIGDISDNIPSIKPKIRKDTINKLINMSEIDRETWIDENGCRKAYELNKLLIDLSKIPKNYSDAFYIKLEKLI